LKKEILMSNQFSNIKCTNENGVARIIVDKPPANVLDIVTMKEINQAIESYNNDKTIKLLVITAAGKFFSAGVDVKDHTPDKVDEMIRVFHKMFRLLHAFPQPTLAVVNGDALGGGCELAIFCDMIIAAEGAKFAQPEIVVGVFPPIAAIVLPRILGRRKAMELLLSGNSIDAGEACRLGMVNQVVPRDKLEEASEKFISKLSGLSGLVLKMTKKAIFQGIDNDFENVLKNVEDVYLKQLMVTKDANEGLKAFLEKRKAVWKNE
jgi:cyclohexa-1,5-dienecarbonyl-CoA hydratase